MGRTLLYSSSIKSRTSLINLARLASYLGGKGEVNGLGEDGGGGRRKDGRGLLWGEEGVEEGK